MKIIEHTQEYEKIIRLLRENPRGLSIKEISEELGLNRNSAAKFLDILHLRGNVDVHYLGKAKVFFLSNRIPFNKFLTLHWNYFIAINRDSDVIFANEPLCHLLSVPPGQVIGKKINSIGFPPLWDNNAGLAIKMAIGGLESIKDLEFVFRKKEHFFSISFLPTVFENGSIGVCIGMQDKTLVRDLEKTVDRLSTERELITGGSGGYVIQFFKNGRIHFANDAFCAMTGMTREELYRKSALEFIPEKDRHAFMTSFHAMTTEHPVAEAELQVSLRDGAVHWQKWKYRGIIHNGKITEFQAFGFDITDYKTRESQLRKNYEDLEQVAEEKTRSLELAHKTLQKEMGEKKLLERDNYLSWFVIDHAYDMIVWFDHRGYVRFANRKLIKHLGCNSSEVDKLTFFDIFTDSGPGDWEYIWGRIQAGPGVFYEARLAGGTCKPVDAEIVLNYINHENHQICCCFIRDVTERKKIERALCESEAVLRSVINGVPLPQFVINRDHQVIFWNKALEELTGTLSKDVLGTSHQWKPFYNEEKPCLCDLLLENRVEELSDYYEGTCRPSGLIQGAYEGRISLPALKNGNNWLHYTAALIRNQEGEVIGALETLEDITDYTTAKDDLSAWGRYYRALIGGVSDSIIMLNAEGITTYVSPVLCKTSGFRTDELLGRHFTEFVTGEDKKRLIQEFSNLLMEPGSIKTFSAETCKKNGRVRCMEWVAGNMLDVRGVSGVIITCRDTTEKETGSATLHI
jgi:PAS domain S-box-containing protein